MPSRVLEAPPPPAPRAKIVHEETEVVVVAAELVQGDGLSRRDSEAMELEADDSLLDEEDGDEDGYSEDEEEAPIVHVEVRLSPHSRILPSLIEANVRPLLLSQYSTLSESTTVPERIWEDVPILGQNVERIHVAECDANVVLSEARVEIHVYTAAADGVESISGGLDDDDDDEIKTAAGSVLTLPNAALDGLWDTLVYDDDVKPRLLSYIYSSMLFGDEVDPNVISWNRLALLYGPPGTGKTSLCRALANKLAIRMSDTYSSGKIVEINSHSLFSKWFSESGKLVQHIFDVIHGMIADESCFVVVMIDEVESLTAARAGAMNGSEPSDAVRVVNALLTQLDKLKAFSNVLVMTTSNLAGAIDPAFVDRADIKQYVGLPPPQAVYWILSSCLAELGRTGLAVGARNLLPWSRLAGAIHPEEKRGAERARLASLSLATVAQRCHALGLSGRFLRKVPLMAHARYLSRRSSVGVGKWVEAIAKAVEDEAGVRALLDQAEGRRGVA